MSTVVISIVIALSHLHITFQVHTLQIKIICSRRYQKKKKKGKYYHVIRCSDGGIRASAVFRTLLQSSNHGRRIHLWTVSPGAPSRATTIWPCHTAPTLGQFTTGMQRSSNSWPPQFCITATKQQFRRGNPTS